MCGISGIVGENWQAAMLETMVRVQTHRGPDDSGTYISPDGGVGLGLNRLSIIDLSERGHQPMAGADGALWIVFNGEIYNYLELRAEITDYPYQSDTDTEVILAAYEKWGAACVEHFNGMFAFAIWDARKGMLFCARDRLGVKPFHYAWHNGCFYFASEAKALLAVGVSRRANWKTWSQYLTHGLYDHSAETFFADIQTLPPGRTLTLEKDRQLINRYWNLGDCAAEPLDMSATEASQRFRDLLLDSVRLRLQSDVSVGVNLSGGLDSSSLMVCLGELTGSRREIATFTGCFDDARYDEDIHAAEATSQLNCIQHIVRLSPDTVMDLSREAIWYQEAPFGGIATLSYQEVHRNAQALNYKVLLEGQGGDEIAGGYDHFFGSYYLDLLDAGRCADLRREIRCAGELGRRGLALARRLKTPDGAPVYTDGTDFLARDCIQREVREVAGDYPTFERPFSDRLTNAMYENTCFTKLPRVLRMNDRLSMAFSIELRQPFLDYRLVEFAFRLPPSHKIRDGHGKSVLRSAMSGSLPENVCYARKRSVVTPQREWLQGRLRSQVMDMLHSQRFCERGIFDARRAIAWFERFCEGGVANSFPVWQWINTELWFERFDQPTSATETLGLRAGATLRTVKARVPT